MKSLICPLLFFAVIVAVVQAVHNVTVDDTSSLIVYSGNWSNTTSSWDYGGSHSYSQDPTATATFSFTGLSFFRSFWSI
jgi:hypothetical protein